MKKVIYAALFAIALISYSCTDDSTIPSAMKFNFEDMQTLPGYGWFNEEFDKYEVKVEKIEQITNNFNPATHKIVFFTKPTCACPNLPYKRFPQVYKILYAAGVPQSNMEFYSLSSLKASHPYDSVITVATLPAFYVFKANRPVYSICDTFDFNTYYGIQYPIDFEDIIFEGFKK